MSALGVKILARLSRPSTASHHLPATGLNDARVSLDRLMPDWRCTVRGKTILDMGSGEGWHALVFGEAGAARVIGVDIEADKVARSRQRAADRGMSDRVRFTTSVPAWAVEACDIVWSRDGMEHYRDPAGVLEQMKRCLKPGGHLYISFGPTWYSPYGAHMNYFLPLPWVHLLFSEDTIMAVRSRYRRDGAKRFEDVPGGLNRMSVSRFERLINTSGLKILSMERRCVRGHQWLGKIPAGRELFISSVICRLER